MPAFRYLLAAAPLLSFPSLAVAETGPVDAGTIIVTATRTERPVESVGQSVTIVDEEEIAARQAVSAIDILRTVPGVRFNRNGGLGAAAGLSIRGAESDHTVVLIDGVKLNDPAAPGAGFDFGPLLMGNIARVEVVRGAQSVLYGSQAIGGVVNLITRTATDPFALDARAEYGSRDTAHLVGNVSGRAGAASGSLGITYLRTDGISAFSSERGGAERDGFESIGGNGRLTVDVSDTVSLDLRGFYADASIDLDGFPPPLYAFSDTADRSFRKDLVGYAGVNAALLQGRFRNRLGIAYTRVDRRNVDRSLDTAVETFASEGTNRRFEYQGVLDLSRATQLVMGAEHEESRYASSNYGGPDDRESVTVQSLYGQLSLAPLPGLSLIGGVRHDDHRTFGGETTVAGNAAWSPNGGATVIRASYGEGFKAPSLFQLFSDYGNTALQPERARTRDVGITHAFLDRRAQVGVTWFNRTATNLIAYVSCFGSTDALCAERPFGTYDNIARAKADGWEFTLGLEPVDGFDLALQYSVVDAFDRVSGRRLARRARESASLVADWRAPSGLSLGMTVLMTGDSFEDAANTAPLDGYVETDLRAGFALTPQIEVFGRIDNLFDARYETALLYGQPGRSVTAGLRYSM